jgi:hypothetical protein
MKMELELWHLILMLIAFFGCVAAFGKILLDQFEKRVQERFVAYESRLQERFVAYESMQTNEQDAIKKNTGAVQALERDFLKWQAELPLHYVRREDYVRGQSVIEAKLDALYNKLEVVQMKGAKHD